MHRCFDEEQAVRLAAGLLARNEAQLLVNDVESCPGCRALLVEAGIALQPPDVLRLEEGEILLGRYELAQRIGRGGMGQVFAAHDLQLGKRVALKTIRDDFSLEPKLILRFQQELLVAQRVNHPNVVRFFDSGSFATQQGHSTHFFTMELLQGQPLSRWRRRRALRDVTGRELSFELSLTQRLQVLEQVASGLSAIHAHRIVHRDLKPQNIMLCGHDPTAPSLDGTAALRAVVLDFGVARSSERVNGLATTSAGLRLGTPDYMAPEILRGQVATTASDVFSFGLVAYEFLFGKHPWPDRGSRAVLSALGELNVLPPRSHTAELSEAVNAVVLQCLKDDPTQRPSANDVAQRLQSGL